MRFKNALKADMTFQFRQGFYWVYLFLTLIYLVVMAKLPDGELKSYAIPFVVYSDPSIVGFFFIGGIVMLEKLQGVLKYLGVTPLAAREYLLSKALSLSLVSLAAGGLITAVTYRGSVNVVLLVMGILLSSTFFTLYGFLVAARARTINQYFIKMVPYMLLIVLPCLFLLVSKDSILLDFLPPIAGVRLVLGAFKGLDAGRALIDAGALVIANVLVLNQCHQTFEKIMVSEEE
ncbi:MAG: ABC transporter permease [Clostridia bacterium]|nr:ABC transporter permease [Clostridia bacterium]